MLNKISNLKLVLGLVLLGLVYLAVTYFDSSKSEELEKQLVAIDTAQVTAIDIISGEETVKLTRDGQQWLVELQTGKKVNAESSKVEGLLDQLIDIRPDRLAAKDQSKWGDYQVDSTGTALRVTEGQTITLDMVIGQSGSTSYLRLADEQEVYASDRFMGLNNKDQINHYRDNTFVEMNTDSLMTIAFSYAGDSSFQLVNYQGSWSFEDGSAADSIKVLDYTRKLGRRYSDSFSEQDGSSVGTSLAEIEISSQSQQPVSIYAYQDLADSVIYQSSLNQDSYYADEKLGQEYFVGRSAFMSDAE
jgi:hypothetical protein